MDTEKLNRWITLLANLGVVAGLIFLAVEIHQNTESLDESRRQAQLQSYQNYLQNLDESFRSLADSPYMAEIFVKYENGGVEALDAIELQRLRWQSQTGLQRLDTLHYLYELGYADPERYESVMRTTGCEHAKRWKLVGIWPQRPSFRAAIEELVELQCE
jgi:hypothetical protein